MHPSDFSRTPGLNHWFSTLDSSCFTCLAIVSERRPSTRFRAKALTCCGAWGELRSALPANWARPGILVTAHSSCCSPSRTSPGRVCGLGDRDRSRRRCSCCCCCCCCCCSAENDASDSPELSMGMSTLFKWKKGKVKLLEQIDDGGSSFFGVRTAEMSV